MGRRVAALAALALACMPAFAQVEPLVSIVPAEPVSGQEFALLIELAGLDGIRVDAMMPELSGPIAFVSSSVSPETGPDGRRGTLVRIVFRALDSGGAEIAGVGVVIGGSRRVLGSWAIDIREPSGAPRRVRAGGSWVGPVTVWRFEPFALAARDRDGRKAVPGAVRSAGLVFERVQQGSSTLIVGVALQDGPHTIPETDAEGPKESLRLPSLAISVKAVPPEIERSRAVGSWTASLALLAGGADPAVGDEIAWEARATGRGSVPWAMPPTVSLTRPDGRTESLGAGASSGTEAELDLETYTGYAFARGSFRADRPGDYTLGVEPYAWLDPADGQVRYATAVPLTVSVKPPAAPTWIPSDSAIACARRLVASAVRRSPDAEAWRGVQAAAERGDWRKASALADALAASPRDAATGMARAALRLLGGDRAKALQELCAYERAFLPPRFAAALAEEAAFSFGASDRPKDALPAPFWFSLSAASFGTCAALAAAVRLLRRRREAIDGAPGVRARGRYAAWACLALSLASVALAAASAWERSRIFVVSFGAPVRTMPSTLAATSFIAEPGYMGRAKAAGPSWLFAEFADGRAGWIEASDLGRY